MSLARTKAIDALSIRDTSAHTSELAENGDITIKTIVIENGLNQEVSIQCVGSANADFSNSFLIGAPFTVSAETNSFGTCDSYIPYWKAIVTCSVAPTDGELTVIIFGVTS